MRSAKNPKRSKACLGLDVSAIPAGVVAGEAEAVPRLLASSKEPLISAADTIGEFDAGLPAKPFEQGRVKALARHPIGFRGVQHEAALPADHLGDQPGKFEDSQFLAGADVNRKLVTIMFHQKNGRIGEVVDVHELARRLT